MKMQTNDRVLMIIPAYNEAGNIKKVISELEESYNQYDYVVITDGSTDGTDRICMENGYNHIRLSANLGLTGCFQTGMKYAYRYGYRYAVQFDGDGQHRPEFIESMKNKMDEGYDIVMGSRFITKDGNMKGMRAIGSRLIKFAIRITTGTMVTDPTCGLRMYNRKMIDIFANRLNYAPEPDTISYLIKNGAKVAEVPVKVADRESGESYLRPFNAAKYMLRMLVSIVFIQNFREKG